MVFTMVELLLRSNVPFSLFFTAVPVFFCTSSVPSALKVPVLLIPILFSFTVRVFPAARVTLPALLIPFDALFVMFKPVRILISPPALFFNP